MPSVRASAVAIQGKLLSVRHDEFAIDFTRFGGGNEREEPVVLLPPSSILLWYLYGGLAYLNFGLRHSTYARLSHADREGT